MSCSKNNNNHNDLCFAVFSNPNLDHWRVPSMLHVGLVERLRCIGGSEDEAVEDRPLKIAVCVCVCTSYALF
jgi:hypothetical protein